MIFDKPKAFQARAGHRAQHVSLPDIGEAPDKTEAPKPLMVDKSTDAFFTPTEAAEDLIAAAHPGKWQRWLEPSAGTGSLVRALQDYEPELKEIVAVERYMPFIPHLEQIDGVDVHSADFLDLNPDDLGLFDGIVMNPPFHRGAAQKHVEHALRFLKPGGQFAAIVPSTFKGGAVVQDLPSGTFSATPVSTKIIIW